MTRRARIATVLTGIAGMSLAAWLALPLWLPLLAEAGMPSGWSLSELVLAGRPWGLPVVLRAEVRGADCRLLALEGLDVSLRWDALPPRFERARAKSIDLDPSCRPRADAAASPAGTGVPVLADGASVEVGRLTVAGWLTEPHRLAGASDGGLLRFRVEGPALDADLAWDAAARRGRVELRRYSGEAAGSAIEADGAIDLAPTGAAGQASLGGRVGLRLPGRVELDMAISGSLDVTHPEAPRLSLSAAVAGTVPPGGSKLDGDLALAWGDGVLTVSALRLGLEQAVMQRLVALRPTLVLARPVVLHPEGPRLGADLGLAAARINIVDGGKLEAPQVRVRLDGDAAGVDWALQGTAGGDIGPLTGRGRLDRQGITGRLRLADQALPRYQPLLPPNAPVALQGGAASLDLSLSWASGSTGPRLEGDATVSKAGIGLTHGSVEGIGAGAVFTFADGTWRISRDRPAAVSVERVTAALTAGAGRARIHGAWPYTAREPLRVEGLRLAILGGELSVDALSLPPSGRAITLALRGIRLEEVSALYGDRTVSLSGTVEGDLPLRLGRDGWTVVGGVLRNGSPVRIRLADAEALAAFKRANPGLADAADWLSDLEVGRLDATLDMAADGTLVLVATIEGRNAQRGDRPVRLNYRHEENVFQLLQSLRIGSDLGRGIEQRLSPQQRSRR